MLLVMVLLFVLVLVLVWIRPANDFMKFMMEMVLGLTWSRAVFVFMERVDTCVGIWCECDVGIQASS